MRHYLREDLAKGRPGSYYTKVQTGTSVDGSPKYHYFYSQDAYQAWIDKDKSRDTNKQGLPSDDLEAKVAKERKESESYVQNKTPSREESDDTEEKLASPRNRQQPLFVRH